MKKILLVINCHDRTRNYSSLIPLFKEKFAYKSLEVSQPREISELANDIKAAVEGDFSLVAAGGGDGTIGLAASLLAGTQIPLMILPMGTVNAFARSMGIPLNSAQALRHYQVDRVKKIDTGCANGKFFLCFMSIGIDAFAVHLLDKNLKSFIGKAAYVVSGIVGLLNMSRIKPFRIGDKEYCHLIVSNMSNYAGYEMFPISDFSDGQMSYAVNSSRGPVKTLKWTYELAHNKCEEYFLLSAGNALRIGFAKPLFAQFDGEPVVISPQEPDKGVLTVEVKKENLKVYY